MLTAFALSTWLVLAGPAPLGGAAPSAAEVVVEMNDANLFEPADVVVATGTTVIWVNVGVEPHTVSADDYSFDSPIVNGGESFSYTFQTAGTFSYSCTVPDHLGMIGTVVVQ
jgi:plastocyanin